MPEEIREVRSVLLNIVFCFLCGNSSVGRAQPCQGWGREFEPRFPLHFFGWVAEWLCSGLQNRGRRFDSDPSLFYKRGWRPKVHIGPGGGIGRRKGLKIPRERSRAGSIPALGTINVYY